MRFHFKNKAEKAAEQKERELRSILEGEIRNDLVSKFKSAFTPGDSRKSFQSYKYYARNGQIDQGNVDNDRQVIAKYRTWLETQTDKNVSDIYRSYLDAHERGLDAAQETLDIRKKVSALPKPNV